MIKLRSIILEVLKNNKHWSKAHIDPSIREHIKELNNLGFVTKQCCSGLPEDHPNTGPVSLRYKKGYILSYHTLNKEQILKIKNSAKNVGLSFERLGAAELHTDNTFANVVDTAVYVGKSKTATLEMWDKFVINLGGNINSRGIKKI